MKNFKLKKLLAIAMIGGLSALSASTVFAAAGDTISNTATLNFTVGGAPTSVPSNTTDFTEDNLVNFTVLTTDAVGGVPVVASATGQVLTFTVTNDGNGAQDFQLSAVNLVDDFDPTVFAIFVEEGTTPGYQAGVDVATFIDELSAPTITPGDNVATVYIVSTIPGLPITDGDIAAMTLVAEVRAGDVNGTPATPAELLVSTNVGAAMTDDAANADIITGAGSEQNVFNDAAGSLPADGLKDGLHSDTSQYIIAAAVLTVGKSSVVIWDPVNGNTNAKAIPGAYVQYTMVITNDALAGASGDLTDLTDALAATLALDPDLLDGAGVPPAVGAATIAVTESFDVAHGNPSLPATPRADPVSCTSIADADGCDIAGQNITITFALLMPAEDLGVVGASPEDYAAGELRPGETVTIVFNAIVQ